MPRCEKWHRQYVLIGSIDWTARRLMTPARGAVAAAAARSPPPPLLYSPALVRVHSLTLPPIIGRFLLLSFHRAQQRFLVHTQVQGIKQSKLSLLLHQEGAHVVAGGGVVLDVGACKRGAGRGEGRPEAPVAHNAGAVHCNLSTHSPLHRGKVSLLQHRQ